MKIVLNLKRYYKMRGMNMKENLLKQIVFLFLAVPLLWGINGAAFAADMDA
jgi:hypothetical protein